MSLAARIAPLAVVLVLAARSAAAQDGLASGQGCPAPDGLYFVDAHSQLVNGVDEARVISLMDHGGVWRTQLSPHLLRAPSTILAMGRERAGRITPMVRLKGDHWGELALGDWRDHVRREVGESGYGGMAEALIWHNGEPDREIKEVHIGADSDWVKAALGFAKQRGWPFIAHMEFNALEGDARAATMRSFEALVSANPDTNFLLIHLGQLPPNETARLIGAHANLAFIASHANDIVIERDQEKEWQDLFQGRAIAPEWRSVVLAHPDRFLFALDNVFAGMWHPRVYISQMQLWWCALGKIPPTAAQAIAHGNAERLWHIAAKPADAVIYTPWAARTALGPVAGEAESGARERETHSQSGSTMGKGGGRHSGANR